MALHLRPDASTTDTEYGTVLLDEATGRYWQLNATASLALRTLLAGGTVDQAADALTEGYAVDAERARADVERLLTGMRAAKVVRG
ncbi:lasso peptide biosynthesis PqqD family chaperone [Streptomyces mobaraensis NBRC 13819 = DSM 40847]|uniref:Lasso peptide biosynthesis PqqD family chaperone n=1 Tax=Streptomyces mobaraensis (strain ATCC 29032 / DSM 40847 / JCM 4168 / NBRC 13819 / NCIMB 11159 / IPCR 16-22) TaxID=1223523 RepID=M3A022_STRM1|nr:lasso peptide biosynthesis PqqD family chaperone [Streptomyces mobaraensis]EME98378.1 hypothetical protein H340_21646 [Streptomyces mobaraensis NBRC 13819 = DSM 40847]QTT76233.1 lasso peptide biosynthesis PqqD family chaperone [Streptomyces mobaraensis NBRC 13819 = DSM 40847]